MPENSLQSPRVTHMSWGHMNIEGIGAGKDFKLYLGGGRAWDWNETGTRHEPGIQPTDIEELLEKGVRILVLSRGMHQHCKIVDSLEILAVCLNPALFPEPRETYRHSMVRVLPDLNTETW